MFWSWPLSALVEGVNIVSGSASAWRRPAGSGWPQMVPRSWYSFQPEPARNPRTTHSTGSGWAFFTIIARPASCARKGWSALREILEAGGEQMVLHEIEPCEPECGKPVQDGAFAGNRVGHDAVEGRDAIRGDEEEAVAEIENFAHFAAADFRDAGQVASEELHVAERMKAERRKCKRMDGKACAVRRNYYPHLQTFTP